MDELIESLDDSEVHRESEKIHVDLGIIARPAKAKGIIFNSPPSSLKSNMTTGRRIRTIRDPPSSTPRSRPRR